MSVVEWYGVFNRHGELEAVESSRDMALECAKNLSLPNKQLTRTIEIVTVIRGDLDAMLLDTMIQAAGNAVARHGAIYHKETISATTVTEGGKAIIVSNNALQDAKTRLETAERVLQALMECKI